MIDAIVHARLIVTMAPSPRTVENGAVAIEAGRILAVGPAEAIARDFPEARQRLGGDDFVALPGFVDGHSHAGHGLVRTLGGDDFPVWREACRTIYMGGATIDFWQAEARLAALERIKAGVTTACAYLGGGDENNRSDSVDVALAYCAAYTEAGGRLILGIGPTRPPFPKQYTVHDGEAPRHVLVDLDRQMATCRALLAHLPSDRVRVALTTPTVNPLIHRGEHFDALCSMAKAMKQMAREAGTQLLMDGQRAGTVAYAGHELSLLDEDTLVSHALDIRPDEIALLAETGATVANNPFCGSSAWGRCPVPELLEAGANVIVCSNGLAPECGADMFRVMRACAHYHRGMLRDPHVLPPGRLMRMTTLDPARFFGLDATLGSLEPGKSADLVLVDLRKPHLAPGLMPLYQLAYHATGQDVHTVMVAGRVVVREGVATLADEASVLRNARSQAGQMLDRTGLHSLLETPPSFWDDRYDRPQYAGPHGPAVPKA
jgi:cytosine/adenosine deaminase-related metal-dependent hydrolase